MIAQFLYKNPRILILCLVTIVVAGTTAFLVLPRLEDPVLGKRVAVISTIYAGADAPQVESLVTMPIEEQLAHIAEIKQVRSNSRAGISNVVIELKDEVDDVETVWSLVRNKMLEVQSDLPDSAQSPELEVFPLKAFAAIIAVGWKTDENSNFSILRRLTKRLRTDILEIPGTEKVDTFGDPGEEFVAEIEPATLAAIGLSTAAIADQVSQRNSNQPSGRLPGADTELPLDMARETLPIDHIGESLISHVGLGESVRLTEIASIRKQLVEPSNSLAIIDGKPAIVLGALVSDDQQIDRWSVELDNVLQNFGASYEQEIDVELLFSQRKHVDQRMKNLLHNLAIGTGAIVLIVLLLMGWRSTLVVGLALPLSALLVIAGMRALSIPIHQMSVTGLIVALGLLIDNAIVIVEEVRSRIMLGEAPRQAIGSSVRQLGMPLFGSTLTTTLAFLPIATLPGPAGEFVGTIAVSVILAICASFLLSMTLIPATTALLKINPNRRGLLSYGLRIPLLESIYKTSLRLIFRFPLLGVLLGLVLPILGFVVSIHLPQQFFPPSDRQQIQIEVERPARDSIAGTRATVDQVREIVANHEYVARQHWFLGGSAPTFFYNVVPRRRGTPFYAQAIVDLKEGQAIGPLVQELQTAIDGQIFDSRVIVRQLEQGPPFDAPLEFRVVGPDLITLGRLGNELRLLLSQTPQVIHTRADVGEFIPKLSLKLDPVAAEKAGLSSTQLAGQLYTTLVGAPAGKIFDGSEELPIRVKLEFGDQSQLDLLAALPMHSRNQNPRNAVDGMPNSNPRPNTSLASLAEFELTADVGAIVRIDGRRVNEIKAYLQAGVLPSTVLKDFKQRLTQTGFELPTGYALEFGGETEQRSQAVNNLIANAIVLFALMLLTLVASFRSFRCALIIAVVGAMSAGLGPLALENFGFPFGFMAIVGTMGLVGVAINDSIVVLAAIRANATSRGGDAAETANVVADCTRHIIATTLTTIVGFLPLILGGGGFWPPLAITIAGGVGGATLLALYFVPSLYLLLTPKQHPSEPDGERLTVAQDA